MPEGLATAPTALTSLGLAEVQHFTWILRADVRKGKAASEPPDANFAQWWLVQGRAEYPYWSYLSDAEKLALFESVGKIQIGPLEQAIPKAMQLVLARRPDVLQKFSVDKNVNALAVAAWFWMMGIREHRFINAVPLSVIAQLDRPVLVNSQGDVKPFSDVPSLSVLMQLAWYLLEPALQAQMPLTESAGRYRYLSWFFAVARPLFQCEGLIANRWRSWLMQCLPIDGANSKAGELPRFALMAHSLMDAKKRPDLTKEHGLEQWRAWTTKAVEPNQPWAWLKETIAYQDNGLPVVDSKRMWAPTSAPAENAHPSSAKTIAPRPIGVNLFGFALGELGLGEDLRMAVEVCKAAKIPYTVININPGKDTGQGDQAMVAELERGGAQRYAINVFCMPGFDVVSRIFLRYGPRAFEGFYNIGWWPWELNVWPKTWQRAFALVDEIWSCSEYSDAMYRRFADKPVTPMPLAASVARAKSYARSHFGLPKSDYLFLYVFDFNSHVVRKNPQAAIAAFQAAFAKQATKAKVGLVLKVMNTKPDDPAWRVFEKMIHADRCIHLISKTLSRPEVLGLIESCDAYVSPHRAEGFGRTLAEAMLFGKPVIATNYSGNTFFMHDQFTLPVNYQLIAVKTGDYHFIESADGAQWANPDTQHMALQMRNAYSKRTSKKWHQEIQGYAQSVFAPERTALLLRDRIAQLVPQLQKASSSRS